MIARAWPNSFKNLYGNEWPRTYVTFDTETSGFDMKRDVITEIAHCLVEDGVITSELSLFLDWSNHPVVPDHWLRPRLLQLKRSMEDAGLPCHVTYEQLKRDGDRPEKVLAYYRDLFKVFQERGILFVGHNSYQFDEAMLNSHFIGFEIDPAGFSFGDNGMFDTHCLEKATQAATSSRMLPRADDTLRSYFHRVHYTRLSGTRSKLTPDCVDRYQLEAKYGIKKEEMHGALVDARCCHYLMEEYRKLLEAAPEPAATLPLVMQPPLGLPAASQPGRRVRGQRNS